MSSSRIRRTLCGFLLSVAQGRAFVTLPPGDLVNIIQQQQQRQQQLRLQARPPRRGPPPAAARPHRRRTEFGGEFREGSMNWIIQQTGKVPYGEESRRYRRTVYGHKDWLRHRSPARLFGNLASTVTSGIVRSLLSEVLIVALVAVAAVLWNSVGVTGWADLTGSLHGPLFGGWSSFLLLSLPALPFTLSAPSLGLLLVFRTNASYGRWLEARTTWGRIVSHSRSLVRQAYVWDTMPAGSAERVRELRLLSDAVWAFPRCLAASLRGAEEDKDEESALRDDLTSRLGQERAAVYMNATPALRPVIALRELTATMDATSIEEKKRVEMDKSVILLGDACEACERIFSSPVPLEYTRHTARFLSSWLLLLPFALWRQFAGSWNHIATIPASAVLAIFLFGIDELAVTLEEPFSILPLEAFCNGIQDVNDEIIDHQ